MAEDITELAKVMGFKEYGLIGHSFGAFVALQHGVDFPGLAKYIVIVSGASSGKEIQEFLNSNFSKIPLQLRERVQQAQIGLQESNSKEEFLDAWGEYTSFYFAYPTDEEKLSDFNKQTREINVRFDVLSYCQNNNYGFYDVSKKLDKVKSSVLLLAGEQDNICSLKGHKYMNEKIPNARLVIFKTGHMIFAENNTKFLEEVRTFIKE